MVPMAENVFSVFGVFPFHGLQQWMKMNVWDLGPKQMN